MRKLFPLLMLALSFNAFSQIPSYVPTNGLVAWYPFTGNANDQSTNANNGTVNGASLTTDRFGNTNSAYTFPNTNDLISLPTISANNILKYSVAGWFQKSSSSAGQDGTIFGQSNGCSGADGLRFYVGQDNGAYWQVEFTNDCAGKGKTQPNRNYSDDTWHFFVVTFDGNPGLIYANSFNIYIDNVLVSQAADSVGNGGSIVVAPIINPISSTTIGNINNGVNPFPGKLDDFGIWNRVLSLPEISNLFSGCNPVNASVTPTGNTTFCQGGNVMMNANTGTNLAYQWMLNGNNISAATNSSYTATQGGNYTVIIDSLGCYGTSSATLVTVNPLQIPSICAVTVDTISKYNIIYWDKTSSTCIDSFIVYRETFTNTYKKIGSVSMDSMSLFIDTVRTLYFPFTGNPNTGTYRYKLQARNTFGIYSSLSLYHNTIYVNQTNGTFTWNHYTIEGQSTPISSLSAYELFRDDNNTGIWSLIGAVSGSQTTIADPNYLNYPNGRWRVETVWSITCDPTRESLNTTRSNIKRTGVTGVKEFDKNEAFKIYPNPANENITIELGQLTVPTSVKIINILDQSMGDEFAIPTSSAKTTKQIDLKNYAKGVYMICIESNGYKTFKKLVVN